MKNTKITKSRKSRKCRKVRKVQIVQKVQKVGKLGRLGKTRKCRRKNLEKLRCFQDFRRNFSGQSEFYTDCLGLVCIVVNSLPTMQLDYVTKIVSF